MTNNQVISAAQFGTAGDGLADDTIPIQKALDSGFPVVRIDRGNYRITHTLLLSSDTRLIADKDARLFLCADTPKHRNEFLISNRNTDSGNENISVSGGVWDGNNTGKCNVKADIYDSNGYSGAAVNFVHVKNLRLSGMTVSNPPAYYFRLAKLRDFIIEDITLTSEEMRDNQDGLHFCGDVHNGTVRRIQAKSYGQTNDDLIALNADDCFERVENFDLPRGIIENIIIEHIQAESCHTFIRLLSVESAIRNITVKDVCGGCRNMAVNMDAARYCRTPLFEEEDYQSGAGRIENVQLENMQVHFTSAKENNPLILCETNCNNLVIRKFARNMHKDTCPGSPAFLARNLTGCTIEYKDLKGNKNMKKLTCKSDTLILNESLSMIHIKTSNP